jgi:hypothetical protein
MDWIIYYSDGSSFTSKDGPPEKAPREGVQVVVCEGEKVGKLPWHSEEFYCWQDETWIPHNERGLWVYLAKEPWPIVLQTYAIHPSKFQDIYQQAVTDPRMSWVPKPEPNL